MDLVSEFLDGTFKEEKTVEQLQKEIDETDLAPQWVSVDDRLPPLETPVLASVHGMDAPIVLEMRIETCNQMVESYFDDFLYWDNPHDDGQDYENRVLAWQPLPEPPK